MNNHFTCNLTFSGSSSISTFVSIYDNERFEATIKIFTNGKTTIKINSAKRSEMRYTGGMVVGN